MTRNNCGAISSLVVFILGIAFITAVPCPATGDLTLDFYKTTCPSAESTIKKVATKYIKKDKTLAAPLLRMHFHDCFVRGCDGSVLLNSTQNNTAEKAAIPNLSLRGFDVIDAVKSELEEICPGVVSCADIVSLVARDAVVAANNAGVSWPVKTGRRDGRVSNVSEVLSNIPSPSFNFSQLNAFFAAKGLSIEDLVVLSGGHTIGVGLCNFFSKRLYNFTGKGDMDPSLDKSYAKELKTKCTSLADNTTTVPMDPHSSLNFDRHYYRTLESNRGLFQSDAALLTDSTAKSIAEKQLEGDNFIQNFKISIQRMGSIGVLTGSAGEIRKRCAFVN